MLKGVDPLLIVDNDETNVMGDPVRRKFRTTDRITDSSKHSTSVIFSAASDGTLLHRI